MTIDLVLGLGNPGEGYAGTRHNVGFRVVEEIARRRGATVWLRRASTDLAVITVVERGIVVLARPLTFMNRSGTAARWLLNELGLTPDRVLVVVDDVDLPLSTIRLRLSGGPGTHNGLRSLCGEIGDGFPRLRVGVRGADMSGDLADYVLSPFAHDETRMADAAAARAADAVELALREGFERAMNIYNRPPNTDQF